MTRTKLWKWVFKRNYFLILSIFLHLIFHETATSNKQTHKHTHANSHTQTYANTHTHTHTHTHMQTHAHTHTHTSNFLMNCSIPRQKDSHFTLCIQITMQTIKSRAACWYRKSYWHNTGISPPWWYFFFFHQYTESSTLVMEARLQY